MICDKCRGKKYNEEGFDDLNPGRKEEWRRGFAVKALNIERL